MSDATQHTVSPNVSMRATTPTRSALRRWRLAVSRVGAIALTLLTLSACDDAEDTGDGDSDAPAGDTRATDTRPSQDGATDVSSPATLADCVADVPLAAGLNETMFLASAEGDTRVAIVRRVIEGTAVGETFPLDLGAFGLVREGSLTCVRAASELTYEWGHHNWDETMTIDRPAGGTYVVTMQLDTVNFSDWINTIEARDASGATLWGPLDLVAETCATEPAGDLNFCQQGTRTDQ